MTVSQIIWHLQKKCHVTSNLIKNEQRKVFPNLTCIWRLIIKMTKLNFQSNEEYLIKQNNFAMKFDSVGFA